MGKVIKKVTVDVEISDEFFEKIIEQHYKPYRAGYSGPVFFLWDFSVI